MVNEVERRFNLKGYLILFLIVMGLLGGLFYLNQADRQTLLERNFATMGTYLTISAYPQTTATDRAISAAYQEIERLNKLFSTHREDSLTRKISQNAGETVPIPAEFYKLLSRADKAYQLTNGRFDITVGPLVDLWGFYSSSQQLPKADEIVQRKQLVGFDKLSYSEDYARLPSPDMRLDFGAIAKGYAVDQAAEVLRKEGVENFLINLGGNIYAGGVSPAGQPWRIGIRNPRSEELDGIIQLSNRGIGTSGDYERSFIHNGQRYSHIIDPVSGYPVQGMAATTIVADDALTADILSTALYLTGLAANHEALNAKKFLLIKTDNGKLNYILTYQFSDLFTEKKPELSAAKIIK